MARPQIVLPSPLPQLKSINYYSPSSVKTYTQCERLWFFQYRLGLRTPPTSAQSLGTALHSQLETYLKTGKTPESILARNGLKWLPGFGEGQFLVEAKLEAPELLSSVKPFVGYIDLLFSPCETLVEIYDHKTTSSVGWSKTADELKSDVQMVTYAKWASLRYPKAVEFHLQHTNFLTNGSNETFATHTTVTKPHVEREWKKIDDTSKRMVALETLTEWKEAKPNWEACGAFGGCPFFGECEKTKPKRKEGEGVFSSFNEAKPEVKPEVKGTTMALSDILAAKVAKKANGAAPAVLPPDAPPSDSYGKKAAPVEEKVVEVKAEVKKGKVIEPKASKGVEAEVSKALKAAPQAGFTLYINCAPVGVETKPLANWVEAIADSIRTEKKVSDLRLLSFAEGAALLAAKIRNNPPTNGDFVATSGTYHMDIALEALASKASLVVRG